jgi:hypothetical protein
MTLLFFLSWDFKVAVVLSSSSIDNTSFITDKLFESTSNDTETEEDSIELLDNSSETEKSCFFVTYYRFSLNLVWSS